MLEEVRSALPGACREALETHSQQGWSCSFPPISVSAAQESQGDEDTFLSFKTPELGFQDIGKKALYIVCVKVTHQTVLRRVRTWRWTEVFGPDFRGSWRSLYKPPIEKRTAECSGD